MTKQEPAPSGGRPCKRCGEPIKRAPQAKYCSEECWKKAKSNPKRRKVDLNYKRKVRLDDIRKPMLSSARQRARKRGLPCTLTLDDIVVPARCPVLGLPLVLNNTKPQDDSPSLDKIFPNLGYVPGNILVISNRANRIKSDATVTEMKMLADFYEKFMSKNWMTPR